LGRIELVMIELEMIESETEVEETPAKPNWDSNSWKK
jgi:hypothetical protein